MGHSIWCQWSSWKFPLLQVSSVPALLGKGVAWRVQQILQRKSITLSEVAAYLGSEKVFFEEEHDNLTEDAVREAEARCEENGIVVRIRHSQVQFLHMVVEFSLKLMWITTLDMGGAHLLHCPRQLSLAQHGEMSITFRFSNYNYMTVVDVDIVAVERKVCSSSCLSWTSGLWLLNAVPHSYIPGKLSQWQCHYCQDDSTVNIVHDADQTKKNDFSKGFETWNGNKLHTV